MYIRWEPALKINIDAIDLEHQMMVMLIKKFDYAIKQGCHKRILIRILLELKQFTQFHFTSEENLMLEINYPGFAEHERIHSHLLAQLDVVAGRINQGTADCEETLAFVWDWLETHVSHHDREIGVFLENNRQPTITQNSYRNIFPRD